ncbi:MAG: glycoside hydrolase family 28 protein [Candidatus Pedobacter colombiensis]|uniref:Glycoside hydrolase family 28 protein n=1 Tax=Candidatus Pedobacter colombiensis TaxID=3121371 RepID=A0AAJ5WAT8_9SPHI|nr:glycoside hydrolase family 28 protein [Pedobacter sp.]WEK20930.1 MAG: glycoside hydrolase family 28 protein [Pedobacter sp.]
MKIDKKLLAVLLLGMMVSGNTAVAQSKSYSWQNLPQSKLPDFPRDTFNIVNYGAKPDGITLNTKSINQAIQACSKKGGGVVLIPQGVWLTGPIVLQNNVNLHVSNAALVQFTGDKSQYELVEGNFEGQKAIRNQSPISGIDLTNIAITGNGIFDGRGEVWRHVKKDKLTEGEWKSLVASGGLIGADAKTWYPSIGYLNGEKAVADGTLPHSGLAKDMMPYKDFFRPNMLVLTNCKKVLIKDATFQNSPAWGIHPVFCENLTIDGVKVRSLPSAQNGDGIDIESSSFVTIQNNILDCGDDGICIKSGKDEEGRRRAKPAQYIVIRNNTVYRAHGGFVIGSEMSGGVHDIFVTDCNFIGTDIGLRFKTARGRGGIVENIHIRNIGMQNVVNDAILFDMYYFAKIPSLNETAGKAVAPPVDEGTPQFRNFFIKNIVCDGAERAILIRGLPEMSVKNIFLEDITIKSRKGADIIKAENITLQNVVLQCDSSSPLIYIENSQNLSFRGLNAIKAPEVFFSVNGNQSKDISVEKTAISSASTQAVFKFGAEKSMLEIRH